MKLKVDTLKTVVSTQVAVCNDLMQVYIQPTEMRSAQPEIIGSVNHSNCQKCVYYETFNSFPLLQP